MIKLIVSSLGKKDEEYGAAFTSLLESNKQDLTNQEVKIIESLLKGYSVTGTYSHPEAFKRDYPELAPATSLKDIIQPSEVNHYYVTLLAERERQRVSRELMVIANEVLSRGLSIEDIEKIRSLPMNDDLEYEEEKLSFKERYLKRKEQPLGIQTGVEDIDNLIGGIPKGLLCTIFGWVGSGKTTQGLNMFYKNTVKNNYNQVYISLEVPKEDIMYNLLCLHSNDPKFSKFPFLPHDRIRKGMLTEEEESYLLEVIEPDLSQYQNNMVILDETDFKDFSFGEIRMRLEEIDERMDRGLDVVYWDHANLFKYSHGAGGRLSQGEIINSYISFIRKLAIRFKKDKETGEWKKLANVILAQANRTGWQKAVRNDGRYSLTALSEANEMERASSFVISVYSSEDMKISKELSYQLLKSRYGQTIYDPLIVYADFERYLIGDEGEGDIELSDSMFDSLMGIDPMDAGFTGELDLDEFEVE